MIDQDVAYSPEELAGSIRRGHCLTIATDAHDRQPFANRTKRARMCCNRRAKSRRTWTGSIGELAARLKQNQSCHRKVPNEKRSVIAPAIVPSRSYVGRMGSPWLRVEQRDWCLMQATVRSSIREKNRCTASGQQSTVKSQVTGRSP